MLILQENVYSFSQLTSTYKHIINYEEYYVYKVNLKNTITFPRMKAWIINFICETQVPPIV